jgi:hypothetical protein
MLCNNCKKEFSIVRNYKQAAPNFFVASMFGGKARACICPTCSANHVPLSELSDLPKGAKVSVDGVTFHRGRVEAKDELGAVGESPSFAQALSVVWDHMPEVASLLTGEPIPEPPKQKKPPHFKYLDDLHKGMK